MIHQINMRTSVALMRNVDAEIRAKEKAEAPTVKTKEQVEKEEKQHAAGAKEPAKPKTVSVWRRKFRPLPEAKAVDLFADVVGDAFILFVAMGLIIYEYYRSSQKPDKNAERIKELDERIEELKRREEELEENERKRLARVQAIEQALYAFRDPKTKQPILAAPTSVSS